MSLVQEIIAACSDEGVRLTTVLRKTLILATRLRNAEMRAWVLSELNGFDDVALLPPHRSFGITAKGLLIGSFGA
jgi:hypothetical protein